MPETESVTPEQATTEDRVLSLVGRLLSADPTLAPIGAAVLAAVHLGLCADSRTFSRAFGIAHALVLREVSDLAETRSLLAIVGRDARTQRTSVTLTEASQALIARA